LANPIFALLELAIATGLSVLAIAAPIISGAVVLGVFGLAIVKITQFIRNRRNPTPAA
jgi:hypothetical protein